MPDQVAAERVFEEEEAEAVAAEQRLEKATDRAAASEAAAAALQVMATYIVLKFKCFVVFLERFFSIQHDYLAIVTKPSPVAFNCVGS